MSYTEETRVPVAKSALEEYIKKEEKVALECCNDCYVTWIARTQMHVRRAWTSGYAFGRQPDAHIDPSDISVLGLSVKQIEFLKTDWIVRTGGDVPATPSRSNR